MEAKEYWAKVGAPILRAKKDEIGRSASNTDLAAQVEAACGKRTTRQLFEHFINGKREPYVSQLVAMCQVMGVDLDSVISPPTVKRRALIQGALTHQVQAKPGQKREKRRL